MFGHLFTLSLVFYSFGCETRFRWWHDINTSLEEPHFCDRSDKVKGLSKTPGWVLYHADIFWDICVLDKKYELEQTFCICTISRLESSPTPHPSSQLKKSCLFHMLQMKSLLRREAHTLTYSAESESEEATMASSPSTNRSGWWHSMRYSICQACTKPWVQASISLREKKKKLPKPRKPNIDPNTHSSGFHAVFSHLGSHVTFPVC